MTCALALQGVTARYASHTVLEDVTLTIAPHRFVSIVGPSGCGKSTLLHLVAGLRELWKTRGLVGAGFSKACGKEAYGDQETTTVNEKGEQVI